MTEKFDSEIAEQIYSYLIDQILSKKLLPGGRIQEMVIANEFHVSRTPVRDALRELAKNGIINIYPNRYTEIAVFDEKKVQDVGLTKIILDRTAVRMAGYYGSRAEYKHLAEIAEKCYACAKNGDLTERIQGDTDFHWDLCKIGKNSTLLTLERPILIQIEYLQASRYVKSEQPEVQYKTHMSVIDSLENGNIEEGVELITTPSIEFYGLEDVPKQIYA